MARCARRAALMARRTRPCDPDARALEHGAPLTRADARSTVSDTPSFVADGPLKLGGAWMATSGARTSVAGARGSAAVQPHAKCGEQSNRSGTPSVWLGARAPVRDLAASTPVVIVRTIQTQTLGGGGWFGGSTKQQRFTGQRWKAIATQMPAYICTEGCKWIRSTCGDLTGWSDCIQATHTTNTMKLFIDSNHLSPYAMSAFVALREKSIPFDVVPIDLQGNEHSGPLYAGVSTTLRIPTLGHDQFTLSESSAICEYLEEIHPATPIYPANVRDRAKAREIQAWLRSDLMPIRMERSTEVVFLKRTPAQLSSVARIAAEKLFKASEQFLSAGHATLFEQWCIADTDLALMLNRLVMAGDQVPERLAQYARTQWQRRSVQEWVNMQRAIQ